MAKIMKGDRISVPDSDQPMIASRDEYNRKVYAMTVSDYEAQSRPGSPRAKEIPYLVMPDGDLIRDFEHGFPDEKGSGIQV